MELRLRIQWNLLEKLGKVETLPSNAGGLGSIPGQGVKIPDASWPGNQNIQQKQCCNKFNKGFKNRPHQKKKKIHASSLYSLRIACVHVESLKHCLTQCDLVDCNPTRLPLSMGFSRQEYCNGLPGPPPGYLPDPGIEPASPVTPALAGSFSLLAETPGKPNPNLG